VYTGYIKIYQIQETLEQYIKMKQEWTVFSTSIASEPQLPIELRRDALFMIIKNKNNTMVCRYRDTVLIDSKGIIRVARTSLCSLWKV
jgi:hypothetical protein